MKQTVLSGYFVENHSDINFSISFRKTQGKLGVERIAFRVQLRIKMTRGILDFRVLLTRCPTCPLPITASDEDDSGKLGKNPSASN